MHALNKSEDITSGSGEESTLSRQSLGYSSEVENNLYLIDPIFIQIHQVSQDTDEAHADLMTPRGT